MDFAGLQQAVFAAYGAGKFQEAFALLASPPQGLTPVQQTRVNFWEACLYTQLGDLDAAVGALTRVQGRGDWFAPVRLERDPDLAPLQEHPGFRALLATWQARQREEAQYHRPTLTLLEPVGTASRTLVALHGNMDSPETLQPLYADLTKHGWRVALAGSGQYGGPEALVWDSATQADEEARTWSGELGGQPVWAGYSAGAGVALRNVLTTAVPASGVLAVAPSVPSNPSWWSEHLTHVPVALILGRTDPHTPNALALAERLRTLGIPLREWTHEGGHTHPDNWKRLRDEALAWLSSGG